MAVPNYVYSILLACAFGACDGDQNCVCKPTLKVEWDPSYQHKICNNATFDWMVHTLLNQISAQNDDIENKEKGIADIMKKLKDSNAEVKNLKNDLKRLAEISNAMEQAITNEREENAKLKILLEESQILSKEKTSELQEENNKLQTTIARLREAQRKAPLTKHCADIQRKGSKYSGIYSVYPDGFEDGFEVFCDLNTDDGGWMVIQRRQDGSQRFDRSWGAYKWGFGQLAREFWFGNEYLYHVTSTGDSEYEVRVDLIDYEGNSAYAMYDSFSVDSGDNKYTLHVGQYTGNAGDSLSHHDGRPFSTKDQDNDESNSGQCSHLFGEGGWWYVRCYDSNLNGAYMQEGQTDQKGVVWYHWYDDHRSLKHVEMKIRPKQFSGEETSKTIKPSES